MSSPRRLGLLAVVAGLAAALAAVGARRRRRADAPTPHDTSHTCACGAVYRVSGVDRHRVYWREGAAESDPVLGDRCVECDAPLPAGHDAVAA
jgi:hypothetical protein